MNKAGTLKNEHPSSKSRFLAAIVPLAMLTALTMIAFANAWPDRFVLDDILFAEPTQRHGLDSLHDMFTKDVWAEQGYDSGLYRPLLLLDISLESRIFGDWLAGYHLSNIFLHLLVTFLIYGFFLHLLRTSSNHSSSPDLYALLAALVFAVHPIHTEVVNSVFNRSGMMVALFGLAGLWWLLHYQDTRPGKAWFGLGIVYFLGMLSKESAVVFPALAVVLILLLTPGVLATRIRKCLPVFWLLVPLALYLAMRANALAPSVLESGDLAAIFDSVTLPGSSTFLTVAGILGESMKVIVLPYPLHLYYDLPSTRMSWGSLALHLALIITALIQLKRKRYSLAAGLAFFYIALLPATRIIGMGESGPHVAERYLYFPSAGLTILLAFAFRAFAQHFGARVLVGLGMPVLLVLTALTWQRNADWASNLTLFEAEYQHGYRNENILRLLTGQYVSTNNFSLVVNICDENWEKQEEYAIFVNHCAAAYENQRRYEAAERAYLFASNHPDAEVSEIIYLAYFYIRLERPQDAEKQFIAAIDRSNDPADKAFYQGELIARLNPNNREQVIIAKGYFEEALRLRPGWPQAESMLRRLLNVLNSLPHQEIDGEDS